jgi:hypothetical protein
LHGMVVKMKTLNDLISQITDEHVLTYLHEIEKHGFYWRRDGNVVDIEKAEEFADKWSNEIGLLHEDFERTKDLKYLTDIINLCCSIHNLLYQKDTAYLFVVKDGMLIRFINDADECLHFFRETKCQSKES